MGTQLYAATFHMIIDQNHVDFYLSDLYFERTTRFVCIFIDTNTNEKIIINFTL